MSNGGLGVYCQEAEKRTNQKQKETDYKELPQDKTCIWLLGVAKEAFIVTGERWEEMVAQVKCGGSDGGCSWGRKSQRYCQCEQM